MTEPRKKLTIYIDETDMWEEVPLYEAIVRRLERSGIAGATVYTGIMGFGAHHRVHRKRLFGISDDRPVVIESVDLPDRITEVVTVIRPMVREGLMVLSDVEVVV